MTASCLSLTQRLQRARLCAPLVALAVGVPAHGLTGVPIIQPGVPGEPARELRADEAIKIGAS